MSPVKKITFTLIAVVGIPALFFILMELGLRIIGVGTHYDYFHEKEINGELHFQENKAFANQFYPASLGIAPLSNTLKIETESNHIRVFVLGGSAAQGFPHRNHGIDRHLGAHLRAALPDKKVEVINTAMTSVNSHVVYEVARTLPNNAGDYAVILMGNNEVVGPYGPSTFDQNFVSSLFMIRTLQSLKRTRTWQALAMLIQQFRPDREGQEMEWEGMQMFSEFSVTHDDPRLADVYSHYENNLRDIIDMLQDKGMHVILSSVPVNLRHSAPFGSSHRNDITEAELDNWKTLNSQANLAFDQKNWAAAEEAYRALLDIDGEYADTHFRLATALENLQNYELAQEHFENALRFDTRRFRTDSVINEIIAKLAQDEKNQQLSYVDSVAVFDTVSEPYTPGWNLLHEHVHFDYDGNYHLARGFTQAIVSDLRPTANYQRLSQNQAASIIGFPNHETEQVMTRLLQMVRKAPFTETSNYAELDAFTESRKNEIDEMVGTPAEMIELREPIVAAGMADWKMHYELTELNRFLGNNDAASFHLSELNKLHPHNHESLIKMAESLSRSGKYGQAIDFLRRSLNYTRNDETKETQALGLIGLNYMRINDYERGKEYFEQIVDNYSDQIGANFRAYGTLVKFARDNNNSKDLNRYVNAAERYANLLINQDRASEFPKLYQRMAQIMLIAGNRKESERWQEMQPKN